MTDIEKIAEKIIREAVQRGGTVGCYRSISDCGDGEWEKAKSILQQFGAVEEWNDGQGGFKFTVNAEGEKFNAAGGFKQLHHNQELREKEVEATVSAADSAKKSATYAKWAIIIATLALAVSIISLVIGPQ